MARFMGRCGFLRRVARGASSLALATACVGAPAPTIDLGSPAIPSDPTVEEETADPADPGDPVDVGGPADPGEPVVQAGLQDADFDPLGGLDVRLCNADGCFDALTSADGVFTFDTIPPGRYAASNVTFPGSSAADDALVWSPFFDYIDVPEEGVLDWRDQPWIVPQVAERYPLGQGRQTLSFADGALTVSFNAESLVWPESVFGVGMPTIGAVEVPEVGWPRHGFGWAEHVRVFAFAPFDLETTDPDGFEVTMEVGEPVIPDGAGLVAFVAGWSEDRPYAGFDRHDVVVEGTRVRFQTSRLSWVVASVYGKERP